MVVIFGPNCKYDYLDPYNISEKKASETVNEADHIQKLSFEEFEFYLCIKKYPGFYILVKGSKMFKNFLIDEVYEIHNDIVESRVLKTLNLLEILAKFYHKVGDQFAFAGIKSNFIMGYQYVGIPKILGNYENGLAEGHLLNEFLEIPSDSTNTRKPIVFLFKVRKGNFVDFIHILLLYILNPIKYHNYLSTSESISYK